MLSRWPLQVLLVPAWVYGTALPGRIGGTLLGLGAAAAADAALVVRDRVSLLALLGVLAWCCRRWWCTS